MRGGSPEETLRRLTIGGPTLSFAIPGRRDAIVGEAVGLDLRTASLLRIGALVALDAPVAAYIGEVDAASRAGAQLDDLVAVLMAVAGTVGSARVQAAAPRIALAAGYDVEGDLE
jgi:alkylhydroperoxidase/carboxymuconolactone decarboxylase family protein YurZ